ncbi:Regulatory LuxR family protein [Kosakonia sp. BK9b]
MYIISQDNYFISGMDRLLKNINPYATHTLVVFDRGDGKIVFFSMHSLRHILAEKKDFHTFICSKFIKLDKCIPMSFMENEVRKILTFLKGKDQGDRIREVHLSVVEYNVMTMVLDGRPNSYIIEALNLDRKIVSNYKNALLRKLGLKSMAELVLIYKNWNACFYCTDGHVTSDIKLIPHAETNELKMIRQIALEQDDDFYLSVV